MKSYCKPGCKGGDQPFSVPDGDEDTWFEIVTKKFNAKAHYALLQALNDDNITRVIHCKSVYKIWPHLVVRVHHKSRELRLISCIPNMKICYE